MVANQGCKKCRLSFSIDSNERNYSMYEIFGFNSEEEFRKHNSGNKKCPAKHCETSSVTQSSEDSEAIVNLLPSPIWPSYTKNCEIINECDYCFNQQMRDLILKNHIDGDGRKLWFITSEIAANDLLAGILDPNIQYLTLVADPGSGKTMVTHNLIYIISKLPFDCSICPNSITITTGMSDKEWYTQIINNFKLRNKKFLWDEINYISDNNCIDHRSNFHKRITFLLNNPRFINDHIFIIDECHFADETDMTIDNELKRLGLTEQRMKEYNIKIILISATPDVNLSLMNSQDNHKLVQLKNGESYKGFKYYRDNDMIIDYNDNIDIESFIRSNWMNPKYHFIRARTQQENGKYRIEIVEICYKNNWRLIEDDSESNIYLSFKKDENERIADIENKTIIKTYEEPLVHTFILIKNKYAASKRLKITQYTGLISEKPSKKRNTTATCNGLIPRFFGYDPLPNFINDQKPLFLCDKKSIEEYIKFSEDFIYKGKDYSGSRIKSDEKKIKELKNTCYGIIANATPKIHDSQIDISPPFDSTEPIKDYLLNTCRFREARILVRDIEFDPSKTVNGYIYPKRNIPGHTWNIAGDTFLTEEKYKEKFVNKGQGSNINRQGRNATGQCFVVYPVYKNANSEPDDLKYYVHSLKV